MTRDAALFLNTGRSIRHEEGHQGRLVIDFHFISWPRGSCECFHIMSSIQIENSIKYHGPIYRGKLVWLLSPE